MKTNGREVPCWGSAPILATCSRSAPPAERVAVARWAVFTAVERPGPYEMLPAPLRRLLAENGVDFVQLALPGREAEFLSSLWQRPGIRQQDRGAGVLIEAIGAAMIAGHFMDRSDPALRALDDVGRPTSSSCSKCSIPPMPESSRVNSSAGTAAGLATCTSPTIRGAGSLAPAHWTSHPCSD